MAFTKRQAVLLLVLVTAVAYANTLSNEFVWDDGILVADNSHIRNSTYISTAFTTDLFHQDQSSSGYYRPLQTISLMADYFFWGLAPFGYHLTNVLLHLLCVLLVWKLVSRLGGNNTLALAVAALFAVHPVNTNAVAYISGRADSLAFAAMLASLLLFIRHRSNQNDSTFVRASIYAGSLACYVAALFSRESALLFPLLVLLYCLTLGAATRNRFLAALLSAAPYVLLAVGFILARAAVLELNNKPVLPAVWMAPLVRTQVILRAIATYFGLLIWPMHLQMERQVVLGGPWLHVLSFAGLVAVAGYVFALRWASRRLPLAHFGLCWAGVTLLPMTGLLSLPATVAEHWLYVPSVGFFLAVAAWITNDKYLYRFAPVFCVVSLTALTARTILRNQDWVNERVLFSKTSETALHSANVRANLGRDYLTSGQQDLALRELLAAERLSPGDPFAKANLAGLYLSVGDLDNALAKVNECLQLDPRNTAAHLRLADFYRKRGEFDQAWRSYTAACGASLEASPRLLFGMFLLGHGRLDEAARVAAEAYELEPGNAEVFNLFGAILSAKQQFDKAEQAFQLAASLDRHSPNARLNLKRLASERDAQSVAPHDQRSGR